MSVDPLVLVEALGWVATATFIGSYFFSRPETLVRVQMAGGLLWVGYGALVGAKPVIAANLLVVVAAAWKTWRSPSGPAAGHAPGGPERRAPAVPSATPEMTP